MTPLEWIERSAGRFARYLRPNAVTIPLAVILSPLILLIALAYWAYRKVTQ